MVTANIANDYTTISHIALILLIVMALIGFSLVRSVRRLEDEEELRQREVTLLKRQNKELKKKCEAKQSLIDWYVDRAREGGADVEG